MRPLHVAGLVAAGAALAYLLARQVAPQQTGEFETAVTNSLENLIARFEGYRASPYQDQAGLWTIGFGHLIIPGDGFYHPAHNPDGARTVTVDAARELYDSDTAIARAAVDQAVSVPLNDSQRAALVSLAYNIGGSAFKNSTLVRKLNAWDYDGAAQEFLRWNKVRGESGELIISAGLTTRREQEREIFLT